MPEIDLKIPIALSLGNVNSDLKPGRHTLTDEQMSSWFIKGLIEDGKIEVITKAKKKKPDTLDYSQYKITLGEGGKPVRMDKIETPAVIKDESAKIDEPQQEKSKWEKIVGNEEDLKDVSNTQEEAPSIEPKKTKLVKVKKV